MVQVSRCKLSKSIRKPEDSRGRRCSQWVSAAVCQRKDTAKFSAVIVLTFPFPFFRILPFIFILSNIERIKHKTFPRRFPTKTTKIFLNPQMSPNFAAQQCSTGIPTGAAAPPSPGQRARPRHRLCGVQSRRGGRARLAAARPPCGGARQHYQWPETSAPLPAPSASQPPLLPEVTQRCTRQ